MNKSYLSRETKDGTQLTIEQIAAICPSAVTEVRDGNTGEIVRKVNFTTLRQLLGDLAVDTPREAYDFTWVGKNAARREAAAPIDMTLRPCVEESKEWDTTKNLYIEGDNLQVLKLLQNYYAGQIKMIYIDPPYNTGKDFVYHDDFHQSQSDYEAAAGVRDELGNSYYVNNDSNGRFHSDWCSMIYARLLVARNLLADDGIIFMSIDDNEVENLRKICDEVFGESNFKSNSIIINNRGGRDYGGIALQHDYILIYTKLLGELNLIEEENKKFQHYDSQGGFNLMELRNRNVKFNDKNRPNLCYPFYVNPSKRDANGLLEIALEPQEGFVEVWPAKSNGIQTVWRWGKEEKSRKGLNVEIFGKANANGGYMIVQKYRKTEKMQRSVWDEKEFVNERGTEAVKEIFNGKAYFDYPKSVFTIKRVLELGTSNDSLVLDFFSGSSTTAQALMELNATDGGKRKYIMVQLPEETEEDSDARKDGYLNLCEVAKERIRRAGKKIKEVNPNAKDLDTGFRVLKLDESNFKQVSFPANQYSQDMLAGLWDNIKEDRTDLDLLFDCMLRWGVELSLPIERIEADHCQILNVNEGDLVACLDRNGKVTEAVIDAIAAMHPLRIVLLDTAFEEASQKMNIYELFKQRLGWSDDQASKQIRVI